MFEQITEFRENQISYFWHNQLWIATIAKLKKKNQILWFVWTWGVVKEVAPATLMVSDLLV